MFPMVGSYFAGLFGRVPSLYIEIPSALCLDNGVFTRARGAEPVVALSCTLFNLMTPDDPLSVPYQRKHLLFFFFSSVGSNPPLGSQAPPRFLGSFPGVWYSCTRSLLRFQLLNARLAAVQLFESGRHKVPLNPSFFF